MATTSQTAGGSNRVGAEVVGTVAPATSAYRCRFCTQSFATKIGVGVHVSSSHKRDDNDQIIIARSNARWPIEE